MMKFDQKSGWGGPCGFIKLFMEICGHNNPRNHNTNNIEQISYGGIE